MARKSNNSVGDSSPGGESKQPRAARPRRSKSTALPGPVEASIPVAVSEAADMAMPIEVSSLDEAATFTYEDVARRAYEMYAEQGFVHGRDVEHWLAAEAELRGKGR